MGLIAAGIIMTYPPVTVGNAFASAYSRTGQPSDGTDEDTADCAVGQKLWQTQFWQLI